MFIKECAEDAYFAASNSAHGFFSYYEKCFGDKRIERLYAVKGGPGTGKSSFLRAVFSFFSERGWQAELILCSSDPDSLDGLILTRGEHSIALLDATAPHVWEPRLPGCREELVDLGAFWDSKALIRAREQIEALNLAKMQAYCRAYHALCGAGEMMKSVASLIEPCMKRAELLHYAERLMCRLGKGSGYTEQPILIRSIGMRGEVALSAAPQRAERLYLVEDYRSTACYLLEALRALAERQGLRVRVSHDPILPERLDGLMLTESGVAFVVADKAEATPLHKQIRMRRFVELPANAAMLREELNGAERLRRALIGQALSAFSAVKRSHFALEEIYSSAMDFEAKENFTKAFCLSIEGLQKL